MKKVILSTLIIFVFGFTNAQTKKETSFGIKGGLNIATWIGDVGNVNSKIGFHIGGFAEIKVSNKFSFQPELLYSTQGVTFKNVLVNVGGIDYSADGKINLSYLNIPILVKYYAMKKFSLEAGPQIGFLTAAKTEATVNGNTVVEDIKYNFESLEFSMNFGAGYNFTKNISAGVRYNFGLSNIAKEQSGYKSNVKNSILSLSVGYKF